MTRLRFLTAGESHGPALVGILDGMPAGVRLLAEHLERDLQRRKLGYGRGGRMKIEPELPRILAGVRHGLTLGSPLAVLIENADHAKAWADRMAVEPVADPGREVSLPRPGHADLTGAIKFGHRDLRNSLERASARETAMRVALAAAVRRLLDELDVRVGSFVTSIGTAHAPAGVPPELWELATEDADELGLRADGSSVRALDAAADEAFRVQIEEAQKRRDTVGGTFEVRVTGLPPGLGSYTQHDLRLDALLARALASIPAIKAVELGDGWRNAELFGSQVHDPMDRGGGGVLRETNHAGGLEGGVSNGEPLVARAAMKPIATVPAALRSVDLATGAPDAAHVERSDTCAVPAAAVVGEAVVALAVGDALLSKLGGDSLDELQAALRRAWQRARLLAGHVFLCGLPGSGKSTVAPLLAAKLRIPCLDLDQQIERGAGRCRSWRGGGGTGGRGRAAVQAGWRLARRAARSAAPGVAAGAAPRGARVPLRAAGEREEHGGAAARGEAGDPVPRSRPADRTRCRPLGAGDLCRGGGVRVPGARGGGAPGGGERSPFRHRARRRRGHHPRRTSLGPPHRAPRLAVRAGRPVRFAGSERPTAARRRSGRAHGAARGSARSALRAPRRRSGGGRGTDGGASGRAVRGGRALPGGAACLALSWTSSSPPARAPAACSPPAG
ncbi:MAG: chorismate synthase [Deltaproteobacteria bacterium]|nr:MAG: chorismate synthase [Deltaproteobacteria bacterium]